jgi:hypothetical protein
VRIQFRQQTLEPREGYFTLVTNIRAGDVVAIDADGDGVPDVGDNCATVANGTQVNSDGDGMGDACDNCPYLDNPDQADENHDGVGDRCALDLDRDGHVDGTDVARLAADFGTTRTTPADLDGSGSVDLADLALFARQLRVGIGIEALLDFTPSFSDHSLRGGLALAIPRGMIISAAAGSDLIPHPGRYALLVRSNTDGEPESEGIITSLPFVPSGPRLTLLTLSESSEVNARLRVLRADADPYLPQAGDVLVDVPVRNDAPGTGANARFLQQHVDLAAWYDAAHPLRSSRLKVQIRQHTLRGGFGYFTLVGALRTGP